ISRMGAAGPVQARWRGSRRLLRAVPMPNELHDGTTEMWRFAFLLDVILTRDTWMHRVDVATATGRPLDLTATHDGRIVADVVARTPEWSPEVDRCTWLDGATGPAVGARFAARNRRRWFAWTNRPVVDVADAGREFAFTRTERGGGSIRWRYRLRPDAGGTTV